MTNRMGKGSDLFLSIANSVEWDEHSRAENPDLPEKRF